MSLITRLGRYSSWTFADQFVQLGLPRLVLFPILASMMGDQSFGTLVIALGLVQLVGLSPSNGLVGYIIRDFVREDAEGQRLLMRTTLVLSAAVILPFGLFFIFGAGLLGRVYPDYAGLVRLLPFLGVYLLLINVVETSLTLHRVRRTFGTMVLVHSVQTCLLFLAIPLYQQLGISGVALAYPVAATAALIASAGVARTFYLAKPVYSPTFARAAMRVWPAFSFSAFIMLSAGYLDRLVLGYWWSAADVAPFFAAVSTAGILIAPAAQVSNLILSMLGKVENSDRFSRSFHGRYLLAMCAWAALVFVVGSFLGKLLLGILYPAFLADALPLWNYAVGAYAVLNVRTLCRPFVAKFLAPKMLPLMAGISLLGRLVPLLLLVPSGGRMGAVQAFLIGSCLMTLVWLCVYLKNFVFTSAAGTRATAQQGPELETGNGVADLQ